MSKGLQTFIESLFDHFDSMFAGGMEWRGYAEDITIRHPRGEYDTRTAESGSLQGIVDGRVDLLLHENVTFPTYEERSSPKGWIIEYVGEGGVVRGTVTDQGPPLITLQDETLASLTFAPDSEYINTE